MAIKMVLFKKTLVAMVMVANFCGSSGQIVSDMLDSLRSYFDMPGGSIPEAVISDNDYYDFIIIGAGSGGSVVANRLSENRKWSVLLLEAGRDEIFLTDIPIMAAAQTATGYNWGYRSAPLKTACLGLKNAVCNMPRGKALGGTSVINFLLYTRGNKMDFNEWENLGNKGWGYKDVLPYFIKSENCTLCKEIDANFHGTRGYLHIEHPPFSTPILKSFIKAGIDFGYNNTDPNGRIGLGFSKVQATMIRGARCSASKAFLKPIQHRANLSIVPRARVTKILIDPATKHAYGVQFIKDRRKYTVRTKKEVILSAGTINSPHLLMLSGVGPEEDLKKANIKVLQNLKVGYNLQDHMALSVLTFLVNQPITISDVGLHNPFHVFNYIFNGKGPFTIPGGAEALAFVKTDLSEKKNEDYPDIELVLGSGALNGDIYGTLRNLLGITNSFFEKVYGSVKTKPAFGIAPVLMRPKSRGRVIIKDSNSLHWPLIQPNYFENEFDVKVMVEGIKMAIALTKTKHFKKYNATLHNVPIPGCEEQLFGSDDYWGCVVRRVATTLGHQVGTCKMGPKTDPEAVVDPELKVYGVHGLRVVDGSVMPNIVAGHTNAVIYMIGEKASDMIKDTWKNVP